MKRAAFVASLLGSSLLLFMPLLAQQPSVFPQSIAPPPPVAPLDSLAQLSDQLEAVAARVMPAVVSVEANVKPIKPGMPGSKESGSGVIVKLEGRPNFFIVTNFHVVKDAGLPNVTLILKSGRILRPTQLWFDKETDVAFMTGGDWPADLPTVSLGNSDTARVGRLVMAIGNPFGHGWSVSHGIISARERGQVSLGNATRLKEFLQTDAAINPGSSGGPLVDMHGDVVGITTAIASLSRSNSGVGFCVPSNMVKKIMTQLLDKGTIQRGYLGAQLAEMFDPSEALRLGRNDVNGALVEKVIPGSPADIAGLRPADVILGLDNISIRSESQFINLVSGLPPNQVIRLQVWRNRAPFTLDAKVGEWR